jgi:hypothetical protein
MCSARDSAALPALGFPIRASAGHWLFSASPRLIAAVHALHRLLVPRHPPRALTILTVIFSEKSSISPGRRTRRPDTRFIGYCAVFKVREEVPRHSAPKATNAAAGTAAWPVSQNSTAWGAFNQLETRPSKPGRRCLVPVAAGLRLATTSAEARAAGRRPAGHWAGRSATGRPPRRRAP